MKQGADLVASIHPAPPNELHAVSCDTALRVTRFSSPVRANELHNVVGHALCDYSFGDPGSITSRIAVAILPVGDVCRRFQVFALSAFCWSTC